jgi:alkanesulfonate monooxygenase SsuD/methylene tetrahydromethanopterin reductase-like flavin-dependent oxidoreductase (luciferase family)
VATLDLLSGGRFEVGMGAGWLAADHERSGIPYELPAVRIARLAEALYIMKGLFGDAPVTFAGEHYRVANLEGFPKPVQRPHPPILIGASRKRLLSLAAREADVIRAQGALAAREEELRRHERELDDRERLRERAAAARAIEPFVSFSEGLDALAGRSEPPPWR